MCRFHISLEHSASVFRIEVCKVRIDGVMCKGFPQSIDANAGLVPQAETAFIQIIIHISSIHSTEYSTATVSVVKLPPIVRIRFCRCGKRCLTYCKHAWLLIWTLQNNCLENPMLCIGVTSMHLSDTKNMREKYLEIFEKLLNSVFFAYLY
jgi:hypothetical protein